MKLPAGVYVVSQTFEGAEGAVEFTFQGIFYEAQLGINAFVYLEDLAGAVLEAPRQPFCGYEDVPVVILPAGVYRSGTVDGSRFRTYMPCALALLGENAGISPNETDLRTAAARREESIFAGSFYYGAVGMENGTEGTLTLDGLTLESSRVHDERTEGDFAGLTIQNCRFTGALSYDLVRARPLCNGKRLTQLTDCRFDGVGAYWSEGRFLDIGSGDFVIRRLYFANTDKFPGMTNYTRTVQTGIDNLLLQDSLFENCGCIVGFSMQLAPETAANIHLQNCEFYNFGAEESSALSIRLNPQSHLQLTDCRFMGNHPVPAVEIYGEGENFTATDTTQKGYTNLFGRPAPRRTECNSEPYPLDDPHQPLDMDLSPLDTLYQNRSAYYCDFHCHSNSGGVSDGKTPIEEYVDGMKNMGVDCAAIVDHRQMRHFFLPCWDEQYMICGTEPGTHLEGREGSLDYTMIFPDKTGLAQTVGAFPEFGFTNTWLGRFRYADFTVDRFRQLGEYIYKIGGLLSHAHPLQLPGSGQPEDYFFSEHIAFETVHADVNNLSTRQNHQLWVKLLNLGRRLRTHGSSDSHGPVSNRGLTTVYTEKHFSTDIFNTIRSGDCTAGGVGIRMCIDDCPMGSSIPYAPDRKLYIRVGDFHRAHWKPETAYSLKVYTDKGLAYATEFDGTAPVSLVLPVQKRGYYRCEVINESDHCPVAFSNPIWLDESL